MTSVRKKRVKYGEGQWFAVPLTGNRYALGVIVRGSYRKHGGLGYFFGPPRAEVPNDQATWLLSPRDAVMIGWFGDLGIVEGRWPLVASTRPFRREDWPIPRFGNPDTATHGWLTEYAQHSDSSDQPIRREYVRIAELSALPEDGVWGYLAVENWLSSLFTRPS